VEDHVRHEGRTSRLQIRRRNALSEESAEGTGGSRW
jgi:hypothetical protein